MRAVPGRIDVHLVGARVMRRLNRTFTGRRRLTDVLAFDYRDAAAPRPGDGEPGPLAEIFVSPDAAWAAARRFRTSFSREVMRYIVHGLFHLAGYDDHEKSDRRRMRRAERRVLAAVDRRTPCDDLFADPAVNPGEHREA